VACRLRYPRRWPQCPRGGPLDSNCWPRSNRNPSRPQALAAGREQLQQE
jgi:hypothetical protein